MALMGVLPLETVKRAHKNKLDYVKWSSIVWLQRLVCRNGLDRSLAPGNGEKKIESGDVNNMRIVWLWRLSSIAM